MAQECFSPACPCYSSSVFINTVQEEWIFFGLERGWWRNSLPWAPSVVPRKVLSPFLLGLTNPSGSAPEGKREMMELWKERRVNVPSLPDSHRHCAGHIERLTRSASAPQNPERWSGSLRVTGNPELSDTWAQDGGTPDFGGLELSAHLQTREQALFSKCSYLKIKNNNNKQKTF